jgi:hypothetical protein
MTMHLQFQSLRGGMKKSRFKIWLRTFLCVIFSVVFSFFFSRDIANGHFNWEWVPLTIVLLVPAGLLLSRIVPMQADLKARAVTLSLDRIYLVLIWVLVIARLITGTIPSLVFVADILMCSILGIMFGRLGGIGIRVRQLKLQHGFIQSNSGR